MSYLDELKRIAGTTEVPAKGSPSEFKKTDIGQPSERKKKAQAMYDKLSPDEKRMVDRMILKKRQGSEQSKKVKAQDSRTQSNLKAISKQDTAQRLTEEKEIFARQKAVEKQRSATAKAMEKFEKDKAKSLKDQQTQQKKLATASVEFENGLLDFKEEDAMFMDSLDDPMQKEKFLDDAMVSPINDFSAWEEEKIRRKKLHDRKQLVNLTKLINNLLLENGGDEEAVEQILRERGLGSRFPE